MTLTSEPVEMRKRQRYLSFALGLLLTASGWANPSGADVTSGSASVQQNGAQTTITQSTNQAIIEWQSFSIGQGESVRFIQPDALSAALNRVVGVDPSVILGALQANGQVFLVNPNGIVFGPGSQVDVGGLVVSTLNLTDEDFLAGKLNFTQDSSKALAALINRGTLKIQDNGLLVLAAPLVANEGLILAKQGKVALAAGEAVSVSFDPNELIHFEVSNLGLGEGRVLLAKESVSDVLNGVVSSPALPEATQLVEVDGQLELVSGSGLAINTGEIVVDATEGQAGQVRIDSTTGTVLGGKSRVSARGVGEKSGGGDIRVLSQGTAVALPGSQVDISAGESGDGGFAELSGKTIVQGLKVEGRVKSGQKAKFLIDPPTLTVADGPAPGMPAPDTVYEEDLEASVVDVVLLADETITVEDIADDDIVLTPGVNLTITTTDPAGDGLLFEDEGDAFLTSSTGTISVDSASDIGVGGFISETSVDLLAGGDVGEDDQGAFVSSPALFLSTGGNATLETEIDTLSGSADGDLTIRNDNDILLDGTIAGDRLSVVAEGDITGGASAGDNSLLFANDGTIGSAGQPFSVDIDGDLTVLASDEVAGRSITLTGMVTGESNAVDTTPGDALLNGSQLDLIAFGDLIDILEDFDESDLFNFALESGLDDEDIEELIEQLGEIGDHDHFEDGEGDGNPDKPKNRPGKRGKDSDKSQPLVAQAGLAPKAFTTAALLRVNISQLSQIQVKPFRPSPFDSALRQPQMTANDVLDLSASELSNVDVTIGYNLQGDPILNNPHLSAGDLFELGVGELAEVPIEIHP